MTKEATVARSRDRIGVSLLFCIALCVPGYGQEAGQSSGPASPGSPTQADTRDRNLYEDTSVTSGPVLKRLATNILLDQKEIWTTPFTSTVLRLSGGCW